MIIPRLSLLISIFFLFKDPYLYQGETLELMMHRWTKLEKVTFFKLNIDWN